MVGARRGENGCRPQFTVDAGDFVGNDVQGFIPTDGLVVRDAAVLNVAFPFGIKIDPFQWRKNSLG